MINKLQVLEKATRPLPFDADAVVALANTFNTKAELNAGGPPPSPWGKTPTLDAYEEAVASGAAMLPLNYREQYVEKLEKVLPRLAETAKQGDMYSFLGDILLSAVWQHAPECEVTPQLSRFLGVVSGFYRKFLDSERREKLGIKMVEVIPPLARFSASPVGGPYTLTGDDVKKRIGSPIGVVSLPSSYRDHPLMWMSLAHETGGHDVTHADPGLLDEIGKAVKEMFAPTAKSGDEHEQWGLIWQYWIDEASADVFGFLNGGPSFAFNFTAWLMTLRAQGSKYKIPAVITRTVAAAEGAPLDTHPTDVLRIYLAMGVLSSLTSLDPSIKTAYISVLQKVAQQAAGGANFVEISGEIPSPDDPRTKTGIEIKLPIAEAGNAAKLVGQYIATAPFEALDGRSVQQIVTWDDVDEAEARQLAADYVAGKRSKQDESAIVLAGATLALLEKPDTYERVTKRVNQDLDRIFYNDPFWGLSAEGLPSDLI